MPGRDARCARGNAWSKLKSTLTLRDLILLTIGSVIGSGIFLVPGAVLTQVQRRVLLALLAWIIGGVLSLLGALTYGELSASNPEAGGLYIFIRDAFGSFLMGSGLQLAIFSTTGREFVAVWPQSFRLLRDQSLARSNAEIDLFCGLREESSTQRRKNRRLQI